MRLMSSSYLTSVLRALDKGKRINGEDLYKLNEAIFNIPEDETVDNKTALQVFKGAEKVMKAYTTRKYDTSDTDFFYDYVALLGTLQNQYFFDEKQNKLLLNWLADAISQESQPPAPPPQQALNSDVQKAGSLEKENSKLKAELEKLREVSDAIMLFKSFKIPSLPTEEGRGKGKGKGKAKQASDEEEDEEEEDEEEEQARKKKRKPRRSKKDKGGDE